MKLHVEALLSHIRNLGHGARIGLWVEGCPLRCPGCMTPELFKKRESSAREVNDVFEDILRISEGHTGITVSGGEPFEQSAALSDLLRLIRQNTHLDIMVYSGYTLDEIINGTQEMKTLLSSIDILLDGRFEFHDTNTKLWRGSNNQTMVLLTERALRYKHFVEAEYEGKKPLDIRISEDKKLRVIGIPERDFISTFETQALKHGVKLF